MEMRSKVGEEGEEGARLEREEQGLRDRSTV